MKALKFSLWILFAVVLCSIFQFGCTGTEEATEEYLWHPLFDLLGKARQDVYDALPDEDFAEDENRHIYSKRYTFGLFDDKVEEIYIIGGKGTEIFDFEILYFDQAEIVKHFGEPNDTGIWEGEDYIEYYINGVFMVFFDGADYSYVGIFPEQ